MSKDTKTSSRNGKPPLILIHGINTIGEWQNDVEKVLAPFFNLVPIKYTQYSSLGGVKLFFDPWILVGGLAAITFCLLSGQLEPRGPLFWISLAVVLAVSIFCTRIRRKLALNIYRRQAGDAFQAQPNIIAHSFGSYLTALLLRDTPSARVKRMVLVGSVIDCKWDWRIYARRSGLSEVHNEWSAKDKVVPFARIASWLHPGMGASGRLGFDSNEIHVHDVVGPGESCTNCANGEGALVHNINCSTLGHSDAFLVRAHAVLFWLPFFWGINAKEYLTLLDRCDSFLNAEEKCDFARSRSLEHFFRTHSWGWIQNTSVFDKILEIIRERKHSMPPTDQVCNASRATRIFCLSIANAKRDHFHGDDFRMLQPFWALIHAADRVLE